MKKILILICIFLFQTNISISAEIESGGDHAYKENIVFSFPEIVVKDYSLKSRCEKIMQKVAILEQRENTLKNMISGVPERLSVLSKLTAYYDSLIIFGCVDEPED